MDKARRNLNGARRDMEAGDLDLAASRAYYAMFHAAEAALETKQLSFSKHRALIAAFGKEFARTGALSPDLHRALIDAFDRRQRSEYGGPVTISQQEVEDALRVAGEFVEAVEQFLKAKE